MKTNDSLRQQLKNSSCIYRVWRLACCVWVVFSLLLILSSAENIYMQCHLHLFTKSFKDTKATFLFSTINAWWPAIKILVHDCFIWGCIWYKALAFALEILLFLVADNVVYLIRGHYQKLSGKWTLEHPNFLLITQLTYLFFLIFAESNSQKVPTLWSNMSAFACAKCAIYKLQFIITAGFQPKITSIWMSQIMAPLIYNWIQ